MIARGFKPVGWVAAVGGAALGCYMLSLNVAAERSDLAQLERQIADAKRDIRSLQTELGTRGRLSQLEHWNAEVLALSAPTTAQFLKDEMTLARFDRREPTIEDRARVQMAAAEIKPKPAPAIAAGVYMASTVDPVGEPAPLVHRAALAVPTVTPPVSLLPERKPTLVDRAAVATRPSTVPARKASLLGGALAREIDAAAARESGGGKAEAVPRR